MGHAGIEDTSWNQNYDVFNMMTNSDPEIL